ncbi:MAG: queuosine precursor transporter [Planctomycetaceae bacterium]|nr:queuosine precursor transporter [Planctomycetaceae bacterium]
MTGSSDLPLPSSHQHPQRVYRFYDALLVAFVTVLICSNMIAAGKVATLGGFNFGAGVVFFPLSYLFGDILTEVYGYKRSRRVIWAGFSALAFTTAMAWVILNLPPSSAWQHQQAWETVFANSWRIVVASLTAFVAGEWVNSVVLAKMKIWTAGKHLWTRTIGSTIAGEAVDSGIFYPLAFMGLWSNDLLIQVMISNYVLKVATEVVLTPFTYVVVGFLKRVENEDYYDIGTDFNPLPGFK